MFLGWIVDHDLFSEEFEEESINNGVLSDDTLSDEGMVFANDYFDFEKVLFLHDYEATFPGKESCI